MTILGAGGEVLVLLAGRPNDQSYCKDLSGLNGEMTGVGSKFSFAGRLKNGRGNYKSISIGVTHGCGSQVSSFSMLQFMSLTLIGSWVFKTGFRGQW